MSSSLLHTGQCIIVSAPSGAGKTSIVKSLIAQLPILSFSVSACSRDPRKNEVHGQDYYFLGLDVFKQHIEKDDFVEWEEVYTNQYYGTLKQEVDRIWAMKKAVIFDVDVVGGLRLKKKIKDRALSVFIKPPNMAVLESRLRARETETEEKIKQRIDKAHWEMTQADQFDLVVVNDDFNVAVEELIEKIKSFITT